MIKTNALDVANRIGIYIRKTDARVSLFLDKLTDEGLTVAKAGFPSGYVEKEWIADGICIYTTKADAVFIEFGAGFGATHPQAFEFGYIEGSWSREHTRQFYDHQKWVYKGREYTRIPAKMGMYNSAKYMKRVILRVAREVFDD